MLVATIWRDLRWRLIAPLLLVALLGMLVSESYQRGAGRGAPAPLTYMQYLDVGWFRLPGPNAVFLLVAVLIGAGGRLARRDGDAAYLLALPISRRRWVLSHLVASLASVAVTILALDVVLVAGAVRAGASVDIGALLVRSLATLVAASAWIGVALAVLAFVRYAVLAVTLVLAAVVLMPTSGRFGLQIPAKVTPQILPTWDPWYLADPRAWQHGVPLASLACAALLGVAGTVVALMVTERMDL
jgi:hypothetical protein